MPDKQLRYLDSQTAFTDSKGDIDVATGDDRDSAMFQEQLKFRYNKYYDNEFSFSSRLLIERLFAQQLAEKVLTELNGKVISDNGIIKNEYFNIVENNEVTGKEHLTTLFECPKNGRLEYSFKFKGCEVYEQPPLTSQREEFEALHGKDFEVTETQVIDSKGNVIAERPPEYVNSFAIYNNQGKANNIIYPGEKTVKYETGKLGHIKRFKAILPDSKEIWLPSHFEKDILIVDLSGIPQDESLYKAGLIIDPTFGYTTLGASTTNSYAYNNRIQCNNTHYMGEAGTGVSMSIGARCTSGTANVQLGIYDSASPSNFISNSNTPAIPINSSTKGWWTGTYSTAPTLTAVNYKICWIGDTTWYNSGYMAYDSGGSAIEVTGQTYGTWPATLTISTAFSNNTYSVYATYTAGGGATFKPKAFFIN